VVKSYTAKKPAPLLIVPGSMRIFFYRAALPMKLECKKLFFGKYLPRLLPGIGPDFNHSSTTGETQFTTVFVECCGSVVGVMWV